MRNVLWRTEVSPRCAHNGPRVYLEMTSMKPQTEAKLHYGDGLALLADKTL